MIRHSLRQLGITEQVVIHEQGYDQFIEEKGLKQLGQGGEATVYFLRGHAVKVARPDSAPALLREIAHMLHLNRFVGAGGAMGERTREDWPALLWVYSLSDGSLSIGMKPFDNPDSLVPGATLYEHLEAGPPLEREHTLRIVWGICRSLVYAHQSGIIHHDLKPANIYIPSDPQQQPIVFDLAQALWQQGSWGRNWLTHEHNCTYWYNGTYRYMHYQRRLAHLAAVAKATSELPNAQQAEAFKRYKPSFYDDVSAFARILHDMVRSMNTWLSTKDRVTLRKFYRRLLGLKHSSAADTERSGETSIFRRIRLVLGGSHPPAPVVVDHDPPQIAMADVLPPLEKVLSGLS
ncbi:MAG: hypothetical protein NTW87_24320 [Planctomycetota bacterium]|nr:hypothetical protein [Planctomycetota bacterium]